MTTVNVTETFVSIQGESTRAGLPCFFVRLAGCNLACSYCDTPAAKEEGKSLSIDDIVKECGNTGTPIAEITGGEPLLQEGFFELATSLRDETDQEILVETNGTRDISLIPDNVIAVMDIKCPGSGEQDKTDRANITRLRPYDEVKFVMTDRADYEWARSVVLEQGIHTRCAAVLFSPVFGQLEPRQLADWILDDHLPVRLQIQMHKALGMK